MPFHIPDPLAGSGGLSVEGDVEIDAFDGVARIVNLPDTIPLPAASLPEMPAGTVIANITASDAVPTFHPLATLAGAGITYTNVTGVFDLNGSTSIVVTGDQITRAALVGDITAAANSNTTAFRTFAAKSVLVNATNATAVPSDLAGSAAFQYIRVNSSNDGLEWGLLSSHASTSVVYNSNTFERAALTGAITASQNSNATLFGGIRVNGAETTNRTNINFIAGSNVTLTPTDDAGNDEIEITIAATGGGGGSVTPPEGINLTDTDHILEVVISGGGVADWEASFVDMSAGTGGSTTTNNFSAATTTVVAAPGASVQRTVTHANLYCLTAGSFTVQKDVASTDVILLGPIDLDVGERIEFTSSMGWKIYFADGTEKFGPGPAGADGEPGPVGATGPTGLPGGGGSQEDIIREVDDFGIVGDDSVITTATPIITDLAWSCTTNADTGQVDLLAAEAGRPGIIRISTPSGDNRRVLGHRGQFDDISIGAWKGSDILAQTWHLRWSRTMGVGCRFGFFDNTSFSGIASPAGQTGIFFHADTTAEGTNNLYAITMVSGTVTSTNLGLMSTIGVTSFHRYSITQSVLGTVVFAIDGITVATHSTNVPGAASPGINSFWHIINRTGGVATLDIDFYETVSQDLGRS